MQVFTCRRAVYPRPGERFKQIDLAGTIQYMVDQEQAVASKRGRLHGLNAARDAFYRGDIASSIVSYHRHNGGWLREDDLAGFAVEILPPLSVSYGDLDIYTCGPWCQGPVLAQALRLLDGLNIESYAHNSTDYIHLIVETLKLCFSDRHHYFGDPNFVNVPMDTLLSDDYLNARRRQIGLDSAISGMPLPGKITGVSATDDLPARSHPEDVVEATQTDTSYICVVDRFGNLFSSTPSDGMATAPVIPGLGFVPSSRGAQSWTNPEIPSVMAPGKRPRLTPSPAIASKAGRWWMPFGSPGNDVQPQAMLQVLLNVFLSGNELMDALEQPRFATYSFPRSSEPHPYTPDLLKLEGRIPEDVLYELRERGHDASFWPDWEWRAGAVCAIMFDSKTGMLEGAADPRRPGSAVGW